MTDQAEASREEEYWKTAPELPPQVFSALRKADRAINPVPIVATVDPDGSPHTAPFGSLRAVTPKLLRFACNRYHDTYANLCRDGKIMAAFLSPPNIAVSIWGQTRVVKEQMEIGEYLAVIEIDIQGVKNDMMRRGNIESAAGFAPSEDLMEFYVGAIAEIEDM